MAAPGMELFYLATILLFVCLPVMVIGGYLALTTQPVIGTAVLSGAAAVWMTCIVYVIRYA